MPNKNSTITNQSSIKLLSVIEGMASLEAPIRLRELAAYLQIQASTLLRFLNALIEKGYVSHSKDSRKYMLTYKICRLAEQIKSNYNISTTLHQYLIYARDLFGESANLAQEEDGKVVYIDIASSPNKIVTTYHYIGTIAPMHCTGIGKLLLLQYSPEELESLIAKHGLPKLTDNTLTTKETLCAELEQVRRQGYAFDNEECEIGARCVAVPIKNYTGKIVAGISITAPSARLTDEFISGKLPKLIEIGREASKALSYIPNL